MKQFIMRVASSMLLVVFMTAASVVLAVVGICDGLSTIWRGR
jgi:hypothetical protein